MGPKTIFPNLHNLLSKKRIHPITYKKINNRSKIDQSTGALVFTKFAIIFSDAISIVLCTQSSRFYHKMFSKSITRWAHSYSAQSCVLVSDISDNPYQTRNNIYRVIILHNIRNLKFEGACLGMIT